MLLKKNIFIINVAIVGDAVVVEENTFFIIDIAVVGVVAEC